MKQTLYHGSSVSVPSPLTDVGRRELDFGLGFYYDREWLDFITSSRRGEQPWLGYDIIEGGGYTWVYEWPAGELVFDYDAETRSFSTDQTLFLITSLTANDGRGEVFHMPRFRPYKEYAGTPKDPKVTAYIVYSKGALNIAMFEVPLQDTEGRFMDPEKLFYRLFVDDDEPYILYQDEYKNISEDMEEIPYLFSDQKGTIIEKAYGIYIYQTGFDRFGIQTIYRGGGEEHCSNISYWNFGEDDHVEGISNGEKAVPVAYYDLMGRRVSHDSKGISVTRMSDGRVVKTLKKK